MILFNLESVPTLASTHPIVVPASLQLTIRQPKLQWTMFACYKVSSKVGKKSLSTLWATACNAQTKKQLQKLILWDNLSDLFALLQFFYLVWLFEKLYRKEKIHIFRLYLFIHWISINFCICCESFVVIVVLAMNIVCVYVSGLIVICFCVSCLGVGCVRGTYVWFSKILSFVHVSLSLFQRFLWLM